MSSDQPSIYIAAPLFSEAELTYNLKVETALSPYFKTFLPQRDGKLMVDLIRGGMSPAQAQQHIFDIDVGAVKSSTHLFIVLDGRAVDEGAACELGMAKGWGKTCWGLKTDPRQISSPHLEAALSEQFSSLTELEIFLKTRYSPAER